MTTVLNLNKKKSHVDSLMFLDPTGTNSIQRYETLKYDRIDNLTNKQLGYFWRPEEIDVTRDIKDFRALSSIQQHIFTANLKRQILLDTVQGRSPSLAFLPLACIPELEAWITLWSFNETIHSRSYTHIIRNIYSNPSTVFDEILTVKQILDCGNDVSKYYDDLIEYSGYYQLLGFGKHVINGKEIVIEPYELKKHIWLAMLSVNVLEGIRFYVSFACSWAFAELKKMEGNAKIIKLICRDENLHLAFTQTMLKLLPKDDPDFIKIKEECTDVATKMYCDAITQEKKWAEFIFEDGSMIGLNAQLLCEYIEFIGNKRMRSVGLVSPYIVSKTNPLPWTEKWIAGNNVQVAPQEVELSSYIVGGVDMDVDANTLKGFKL